MCLDLIVATDRELSPEQKKAVGRLQLIGVISNLAILIAMQILARTSVIDFWKLLTIGFAAMVTLVGVLAYLVSRVEQISFTTLIRRTNRAMVADLRRSPARLRQRVKDALGRARSR